MRYPLPTTILLVALALPCSTLSALDDANTNAISNAADTFARLASDSAKTGQAPRQTDPAVKPLLDLVFDTSELQKGATQPMSALTNLNTWQGAVLKVGLVYTLAGTGVTDIAALSNTPEITEKIERNTVEFAPEMGRYCDAILWVQGALMDTVAAFLATASPSQREQPKQERHCQNARRIRPDHGWRPDHPADRWIDRQLTSRTRHRPDRNCSQGSQVLAARSAAGSAPARN